MSLRHPVWLNHLLPLSCARGFGSQIIHNTRNALDFFNLSHHIKQRLNRQVHAGHSWFSYQQKKNYVFSTALKSQLEADTIANDTAGWPTHKYEKCLCVQKQLNRNIIVRVCNGSTITLGDIQAQLASLLQTKKKIDNGWMYIYVCKGQYPINMCLFCNVCIGRTANSKKKINSKKKLQTQKKNPLHMCLFCDVWIGRSSNSKIHVHAQKNTLCVYMYFFLSMKAYLRVYLYRDMPW